nr:splicing factor, CC1-like protein [Tanacetum cinerariifolium]
IYNPENSKYYRHKMTSDTNGGNIDINVRKKGRIKSKIKFSIDLITVVAERTRSERDKEKRCDSEAKDIDMDKSHERKVKYRDRERSHDREVKERVRDKSRDIEVKERVREKTSDREVKDRGMKMSRDR